MSRRRADPARSLRRRLLLGILVPVALFIAYNTASLYRQTLSALHTAYDRTLLASAKTIKVHTTTTTGEPVDATFAGPASAQPITAVLAACGYTLGKPPVRAPEPKDDKKADK